jgi:hypothetical protein
MAVISNFCGQLRTTEIKIVEYIKLKKQFVASCNSNTNKIVQTAEQNLAENKCLLLVQKLQKLLVMQ